MFRTYIHTYIHTIQPLWLMIWKSCITFGKVAHMTQLVGRIYATVQCNNALLHKSICKKTKNVTLAYWPRHDHGFWILVKMLTFHTINLEPRFMEIIVTWRYGLDKWNCYHHNISHHYMLCYALCSAYGRIHMYSYADYLGQREETPLLFLFDIIASAWNTLSRLGEIHLAMFEKYCTMKSHSFALVLTLSQHLTPSLSNALPITDTGPEFVLIKPM